MKPFINLSISMKNIKNYYHVEDVPFLLNIFVIILSYSIASVLKMYFLLVKYTSKISIEYADNLQGSSQRNYIYCHWHQDIACYLSVFSRPKNQVWLQHPLWYMKPIHALLSLYGIRYILGSSGNNGQAAANELCSNLKQGNSTTIFPDGPAGPAKQLKHGILHIAQQSGLPIVAIKFEIKRSLKLSSWDKKCIPLPFNDIRVYMSSPISVVDHLESQEILLALSDR